MFKKFYFNLQKKLYKKQTKYTSKSKFENNTKNAKHWAKKQYNNCLKLLSFKL